MTRPASVLIVDADPGRRETLGDTLRIQGHAVETAPAGREGLARLRAHPFVAGIVEVELPDMSGLELLAAIKATSPDTEVILVAGTALLATAVEAFHGGAFAYLAKPFEMEHLLATLDKALEKQGRTRALRESEERHRLITENSNDAVFLMDPKRRLILSNRRATELTGYRKDELSSRSIFALLDLEGAREGQDGFEPAPEVPRVVERQLIRKDGGRLWVEVSVSSLVREGQAVGCLLVVRDIADRKQAEEQLQRQRALFRREKLAAMGSLLSGVAHELNNPLSVVMGQAALLGEAIGDGPLGARVEKLAEATERCARIVRDFLALARQRPPEPQRVNLNGIVCEALALLAEPLRVDMVEKTLDLAENLPALWADPLQLHQVVVNLISNAHEAMRETPRPRRVTLTTRYDPGQACVSLRVADGGPGVPPEIQARIFEPFFTTKPPGQGTGLGLSLCHGILEAHGGSIRVENGPVQGAVFVVELPVEAPLPRGSASAGPGQAEPPIRQGRT